MQQIHVKEEFVSPGVASVGPYSQLVYLSTQSSPIAWVRGQLEILPINVKKHLRGRTVGRRPAGCDLTFIPKLVQEIQESSPVPV